MSEYTATHQVVVSIDAADENEATMRAEALMDIMRNALMPAAPAYEETDIAPECGQ